MCVDAPTGETQLSGNRAADEIVQRAVHHVAERDLGMCERGLLCRDADVAHHRKVEASGEGGTVHGRDQRQRKVETRAVVAIARWPQPFADLGLVHALELSEVEPGTEHSTCTRDDHCFDLLVACELVERIGDLVT